jgi:Prophage maintenance system killer protein
VTSYLTFENILDLSRDAAAPAELLIRDAGLLASAIDRPQAMVFGADAYPTLSRKAAALMDSTARHLALVEGDKRLAWIATAVFLLLNDVDLQAPSVDDGERFVLAVASGEYDLHQIEATITAWSTPAG